MTSTRSEGKPSRKNQPKKIGAIKSSGDRGLARLADSVRKGELVAVIGTGVSMALTEGKFPALSWKGLIQDGLEHGAKKGKLTAQQQAHYQKQLDSSDLDDLLGAAEFMGRKLEAPRGDLYGRWLKNTLEPVQATNKKMESAIRAIQSSGVALCTLNYDPLLERVTGLPTINLSDTAKVAAWMRRETTGILHLHGSWDAPLTCILGIRDYETTLGNESYCQKLLMVERQAAAVWGLSPLMN